MKAIVVREFGGPDVLKVEDVPIPIPGSGQVTIRVFAAGVNPVDTYLRTGKHAHAPKLPYTPGKDAAGVIESVGEGVTRWQKGDRVYTANSESGTYAEIALVDEADLGRLPDEVSFEQGAGIWTPYATAYRALFQKAKATKGETVLVHGASGGVGVAAIQWARNAGLKVFGTASSFEGTGLVTKQGADAVFDHSSEDHLAAIAEATGGKGVDIIIEMLANENLEKDFEALAMFGRIVVVGNRGSLEFNPRVIMGKDATVYGMSLFNSPQADFDEIHEAIYEGLTKGFLDPVIRRTLPLIDSERAHHEVIAEKAFGKIVLVP